MITYYFELLSIIFKISALIIISTFIHFNFCISFHVCVTVCNILPSNKRKKSRYFNKYHLMKTIHVNHGIVCHTQCAKSIEVISHKFVTHFSTDHLLYIPKLQTLYICITIHVILNDHTTLTCS